ncbi:MAG: 4Fe-4S binding protein [Desulfobacterales bacterium]|nr:4Fe-4S binding protein [Desulfobacterales bacterium]
MTKDIYEQLTDKIMLTGSQLIPELFRMVADASEAELLLAMPGTPEELAEKTGRSAVEVEAACQALYHKGVAFKSYRGGSLKYKMCRDMIQFHDATILWPEAPKAFHDLWQRFMDEEWPHFARLADQFFPKAFTRVIPVEQAVDAGSQQVLDIDSADRIILNAGTVAVTRCTCRLIAHKCESPLEVCIQVDNAAKYTLDRGTGREISKDEALQILRDCEDKGLVHVTMNKAHAGHFICNCCDCCCQALPLVISEGLNILDPSRYQAEIDPELCTACGTCEERCVFNAIVPAEPENDDSVMQVVSEKCMGCGLCQAACPEAAITLNAVRPKDFVPE